MLALDEVTVVNGDFRLCADLGIRAGARVAVIGPSGSGKSTLLNAVAGFLPVAEGHIRWRGSDITHAPPGDRPVAMLFQDGNLFPHITVAQNVGLGIRPDLRLSAGEREMVAEALGRVGLGDLGDRKPGALSGGQQSRAALARVLVQGRPLLLLDEPFAALGPALKAEMLDLVAALCDETEATMLMVSHDPDDALRISTDAVLVAEGRAAAPVETRALFADPPDALRDYLG